MRKCSLCKIEKPLEAFEKMPKKKYGFGYRCSECNRSRRKDPNWKLSRVKQCPICKQVFDHGKSSKIFCSPKCNRLAEPERMASPKRYFQASINPKRKNDGLTADDLLSILEKQDGKCALTGVRLTFIRGKGQIDTNCSIDRIEAGGPYKKENVQLVCSAINGFRRNMPIDLFVKWCELVYKAKAKGGRR